MFVKHFPSSLQVKLHGTVITALCESWPEPRVNHAFLDNFAMLILIGLATLSTVMADYPGAKCRHYQQGLAQKLSCVDFFMRCADRRYELRV